MAAVLTPRLAAPALLGLAVIAAGCSAADEHAADAPVTTASAAPVKPKERATPPLSASPSATPDDVHPTAAPAQRLEAGAVADGTSATVSGDGPAEITFVRDGDIAVVVDVDCSACTGPTMLTAPDRVSPLDEADGAMRGSYLVDVFAHTTPEQSVWLLAEGEWTVELSSWNDLPSTTGAVEGSGSTVLLLTDDLPSSVITWAPAHDDDVLQARYFGATEEHALVFGDSAAFSERMEIRRPGVLAIATDGEWSVEP